MKKEALIFFFRHPEKGMVKTRLAAALGDDFVFELYNNFIYDMLDACASVDADTVLAVSGGANADGSGFYGKYICIGQRGNDLGGRMFNAFIDVNTLGYSRMVLVGSDIPDLPAEMLMDAFAKLDNSDVVLGPSPDGGYYLIGLRGEIMDGAIFENVPWGTALVFERTIGNIIAKGLSCDTLSTWNDIDDFDDLKKFYIDNLKNNTAYHTMRFLKKNKRLVSG